MLSWLKRTMVNYITEKQIAAALDVILLRQEVLEKKVDLLMGAIKDFADKMKLHNDAVDAAVDGISADIQALNDKITALQNSNGQVTPEDQALLDDLEARGAALATKIAALDALNPPPQPAVPPSA